MSELTQPIQEKVVDTLRVKVYPQRLALGEAAGNAVGIALKALLNQQQQVRMIFAAAPSQNEFLETLALFEGIDWSRVVVFHMDEYIGLSPTAPQSFGRFLSDRLFDKVKPGEVRLIDSTNTLEAECQRYSALLQAAPIDIVCLGIGENGHIAFNDPPVADFQDPLLVKAVELDLMARQQQVNDGCFEQLSEVPTHAITLTIPALFSGKSLYCMVPGTTKRNAVQQTLNGSISTACPATILRQHPDCTLYVDTDSFA
jgi:glucosamine-6-phosphate deaminase